MGQRCRRDYPPHRDTCATKADRPGFPHSCPWSETGRSVDRDNARAPVLPNRPKTAAASGWRSFVCSCASSFLFFDSISGALARSQTRPTKRRSQICCPNPGILWRQLPGPLQIMSSLRVMCGPFGSPVARTCEQEVAHDLAKAQIPQVTPLQLLSLQALKLHIPLVIRSHTYPIHDCRLDVHPIPGLLPSDEVVPSNGHQVHGHPKTLAEHQIKEGHRDAGTPATAQ